MSAPELDLDVQCHSMRSGRESLSTVLILDFAAKKNDAFTAGRVKIDGNAPSLPKTGFTRKCPRKRTFGPKNLGHFCLKETYIPSRKPEGGVLF